MFPLIRYLLLRSLLYLIPYCAKFLWQTSIRRCSIKFTRMIKLKDFDGRMKVVKNDRLTSTERQNFRSFVVKIDRHCSSTFRSTNSVFENKLSRVSNVPQANAIRLVGWMENRMGRFNNWTIFLLIINCCKNLSRQFNLLETANCLKPHSSERWSVCPRSACRN